MTTVAGRTVVIHDT